MSISPDYTVAQLQVDDQGIAEVGTLLRAVFPHASVTDQYLRWLYLDNPDGTAIGFNAYHGKGQLVAHYVTVPMVAILNGKEERGLLSLNTATLAGHGGKGLFTGLASATYSFARENGLGFVVGVANAASTHGFVRKLGFQKVGALRALIGFGSPSKGSGAECGFSRPYNAEHLSWRLSRPDCNYTVSKISNGRQLILTSSGYAGVNVVMGEFDSGLLPDSLPRSSFGLSLHIGLDPDWHKIQPLHFNIPMRFRPSPLNLIFLDLTDGGRTLDARTVRFRAIDFDAY